MKNKYKYKVFLNHGIPNSPEEQMWCGEFGTKEEAEAHVERLKPNLYEWETLEIKKVKIKLA